mgnify:FL=1|jgi:hypothetical protein|tara:strand:+ start:1852 stop:2151 length:300 start_codon:yes stop_codon:yes gene_type:complete
MEALVPQARNGGYMAEQKKSPSTEEVMVDKVLGWIRSLTEVGLALIALGVVLQVIFGATIPFLGLDIVGSVVALVSKLGSEGLVGLVAIWVLWGIYSKK